MKAKAYGDIVAAMSAEDLAREIAELHWQYTRGN
jgi:hypothetical protein